MRAWGELQFFCAFTLKDWTSITHQCEYLKAWLFSRNSDKYISTTQPQFKNSNCKFHNVQNLYAARRKKLYPCKSNTEVQEVQENFVQIIEFGGEF